MGMHVYRVKTWHADHRSAVAYADEYDKERVSDIQVKGDRVEATLCGSSDMVDTVFECEMYDGVIKAFSMERLD